MLKIKLVSIVIGIVTTFAPVGAVITQAPTITRGEIEGKKQEEVHYAVPEIIERFAEINGADKTLALAIAECESNFKNVPNSNGEIYGKGIYQFIQSTWDSTCSGDIWNVEDNIKCGTKLIGQGQINHWGTAYTDWGSYHCWGSNL